ncbi:MAG TPA: PIN domain nuclease [Ignavibacteria bacterium]|nr:PIN domain nuclease [Ignavibacteria bacterium]
MRVVVDTNIWSLALRRTGSNIKHRELLSTLIEEGLVVMLGPIRQEILSGIKSKEQYHILKNYLSEFPDFNITTHDYEKAAEYFNLCRSKGIQGSNTDFLICSVALRNEFPIYTIDNDFNNYKKVIGIKLYG